MENLSNVSIVQLILNLVVGAGIIAVGIPYVKSQWGKGKVNVQDESNDLLRKLVEDQKKSIDALEIWRKEAIEQIAFLKGRVEGLSSQKSDLERLITAALMEFFKTHPEVPKKVDGQLSKSRKR